MTAPKVTFHGVRGSMPVGSTQSARYGGNTLCIEVDAGPGISVLIDGGTGITRLNHPSPGERVTDYHVFLTHYHWDHIQGLPFFRPLYEQASSFTFYGHTWDGADIEDIVEGALQPPLFPVSIRETASTKRYVTIGSEVIGLGELRISAAPLRHPQGVTAYRIDGPGRSIVIATDCERGDAKADAALRELAAGAGTLVHDAQYQPDEYERLYQGWGHSTWADAADAARDTGVQDLVLISHDPERTDDQIDLFVANARETFPNTTAAFEGMQLTL